MRSFTGAEKKSRVFADPYIAFAGEQCIDVVVVNWRKIPILRILRNGRATALTWHERYIVASSAHMVVTILLACGPETLRGVEIACICTSHGLDK